MKVARSVADLRAALAPVWRKGRRVALVPTMGALHEGHLSLVRAAQAAADHVVVSIFVNPLQFGPREDLDRYPRDEHRDTELLSHEGVDLVFIPDVQEMVPSGSQTTVAVGRLGDVFEGGDRPGHFDGVATIVAKLFNLVRPDVAVFGQKDAQQVAVIKQLVRDLSFDIDLLIQPTVREADGLAMSSRNAYLSSDERERASSIYRSLRAAADTVRAEDVHAGEKKLWELLVGAGLEPSYAAAVDPDTFTEPRTAGPILLVVAARVGGTRLIDNLLVES